MTLRTSFQCGSSFVGVPNDIVRRFGLYFRKDMIDGDCDTDSCDTCKFGTLGDDCPEESDEEFVGELNIDGGPACWGEETFAACVLGSVTP